MHPTQQPIAIDVPGSADEALGLLEQIETQLARLQSAQAGGADQLAQIDRRWSELLHREAQVSEAFGRLDQQERWFASQVAELERRQGDLAAREASVGFERLEFDRQRQSVVDLVTARREADAEIARLGGELETIRRESASRRAELEARAASIEREKQALAQQVQRLEAELSDRTDLVERSELEAAIERSQSLETRLADRERSAAATEQTMSRRLAGLERSLAAAKSAVEEATRRTEDSEATAANSRRLGEQVTALEAKLAAAERTDQTQRTEVERLRSELERAREEVSSLRRPGEADEQARTERLGKAKALEEEAAGLRTRLDRSESECASLRGALEKSRESASQHERRIATLQRQLDHQASQDDAATRLESELAAVRGRFDKASKRITELEQSLKDAETSRNGLEAEIAKFRSQTEPAPQARQEADADAAGLEALEASLEQAKAALRERDARIEALAADLRAARESSRDASNVEVGKLQEKARQLARIANLLRSRRDRLHRLRVALRGRVRQGRETAVGGSTATESVVARPSGQAALHELRQVQQKREELRQIQKFLADSEVRMVRRWATRSAASLAMVVTLFVAGLCAAAWVASDHVWPAPGTASVDMIARGAKGQPLDPRLADEWKQWHAAILADPIFAEEVATRLAARGLSPSDASTVAALLERDLEIDSDGPGRMRLVLKGEDRRLLPPVLDTVATTLAAESASQAPRRPDRTPAIVIGERARDGRIAYSLLDPRPVDEQRVVHAGVLAGSGLAIALAVAVPAAFLLRRVRRVVPEEDLGALAN